jgi:hypothetical protein
MWVGLISYYFIYRNEQSNIYDNCVLGIIVILGALVFFLEIPEEIRHKSKILQGEKVGGRNFIVFWSIYSFISHFVVMVAAINLIIFLLSMIPMVIVGNYVKDINYYWMILIKCVFVISLFFGIWLSYTETIDEIKKIKTQDNTEMNNIE